ncbi:hypothetical protein [Kribbella solani]|uniref:Uncharacterized protein n=1 Tax=Kribbella solani TaxID=236067 RepID=A0A841E509_9ACTN|nr:hypothetical protein [Kribbella solani]MBB5982418.1 hypothetical protein [Kribbella solani]
MTFWESGVPVPSPSRTVKAKFDGDSSGLARAARDGEKEIDRFTKNVDKKYRKSGDDSGKGFINGLKKWFSPSALGDLKKSGEFGGSVFGSGLLGALKTPVLGPAILGVVGATVATVMPAVGAIAGTGLVAGFGAGIAGLGLVFAAKSDKVKSAWQKTIKSMGDDMELLSRPFEDTLVHMSDFAQRTFNRFKPELDSAFKLLAPTITDFGDEASQAFEELAPAIEPVSEAFANVLDSLGPAMQSALHETSQGLVTLAESVKDNPDALADTVKGVGDLTKTLLDGITVLNNINGQVEDLTGGFSLVDGVMGGLQLAVSQVFGPFALLEKGLDAVGLKADKATQAIQINAETTKLWTQGLSQGQLAAMGITGATTGAGNAADTAATKFARQKAATDALIDSTFRLQNLALGLAGAQINYQSAVDAATASVKDNGRTLDINSEKGRANKQALLAVAQAANAQTQSMIESNKGTAAAGRSAEQARGNFVRIATQMGLSKKEADKLAASLIGIPPNKKANVSVAGATAAKGQVDALGRSINNLPKNKVVNVTYKVAGIERTTPSNIIGSAGRSASGGPVQPNRSYLVGERGPELLTMGNQPGQITNAERLKSVASSTSQPIVVENHIEIGGEVVRVVRTEIKADKKETKRRETAGVRAS